MTKFKAFFASLLIMFSIGAVALTVVTPTTYADGGGCTEHPFLTFPAWYRGVENKSDPHCAILSPSDPSIGGLSNFIWRIVLNVIEIVLQIIGFAATIMIIVGGFRFLTSAGNPSGVEAGKKTLTNAIIGLVIALAAIAIVNIIFGLITGFKG
jgi:hypothetical protein